MSKEKNSPLVSIVIPVYNGSNYMREAIDSALAQTYENIEVIVVNDGSRDDGATELIAKEYGNRIRYIYKENGGVSSALNTGIQNMRGEYFSWLSHDDVYTPDKIEKSVSALSEVQGEASVVYCSYVNIDKDSKLMTPFPDTSGKKSTLVSWKQMLFDVFSSKSIHGCALLIKKTVFDNVGFFDEDLRYCQDTVMWIRIFAAGYDVVLLPDACVLGRIHGSQLTQTGSAMFRSDCEKISVSVIPLLSKISTPEDNFLLAYMKYNAKHGNRTVVKKASAEAKKRELFSFQDRAEVALLSGYGIIRPFIRTAYYAVFRKVKTT